MKKLLCLALLSLAAILPQKAWGCTIPVFRYALEKWELTPYEILVFHKGPVPDDVAKELKKWNDGAAKVNIEFTDVDLDDKLTKSQQRIWDREGTAKQLPWMVVRYAAADPTEPSAWKGPCTVANLNSVFDSPVRRAVLSHVTQGATTVWILVTSDDAKKDREVLDLLTKELQALEKKIKLPVQSDTGPQIKLPIPLKVHFPIVVLDRTHAEEAGFIRLLEGTEERLAEAKGPFLFPIFGRGRVLGSIIEKEITAEQILSVSQFLCRECSCQVKELNPGIDMLMVANWNDAFDQLYDKKDPFPMPKLRRTSLSPAEVAPPPPAPAPNVEEPKERTERTPFDVRFGLWLGIGVASGLVLLSGWWVVLQVGRS